MKKFLIVLSTAMLFLGMLTSTPIKAEGVEFVEIKDNGKVIEIDNKENNYVASIETVYLDNDVNKYIVNEFGDIYTLIMDIANNKVYINDFELTTNEYRALNMKQIELLETEKVSLLTLAKDFPKKGNILSVYEEKHVQYEYNLKNHIHDDLRSRCTTCPLQTIAVPTTNYKSKSYFVGSYTTSEVIAMTTNSIALVASAMTFGLLSTAKKLIQNFLSKLGLSSVRALITYESYQYLHNVCYKAVKERRDGMIKDKKTSKLVSNTAYNHFYSSRP